MFSPSFDINPCHSLVFDRDHLRSNMGIISGPGSFAVQFGDYLRTRTVQSWTYLQIPQKKDSKEIKVVTLKAGLKDLRATAS